MIRKGLLTAVAVACMAIGLHFAGAAPAAEAPAYVDGPALTIPAALAESDSLAGLDRAIAEARILFYRGSVEVRIDAERLKLRLQPAALKAVMEARRSASPLNRLLAGLSRTRPADIRILLEIDAAQLQAALHPISVGLHRPAKNPRFRLQHGKPAVIPAVEGRALDFAAVPRDLADAMSMLLAAGAAERTPFPQEVRVALRLRKLAPSIQNGELELLTRELAAFSTGLGGSSRNRVFNIQKAAAAVNGAVIGPGQELSYNQLVGPRSARAGFRNAPVIINGEKREGIGGGICQVSSTLYNAALLAGLKIVSRRPHSRPVPYVPAGRDATVVDGAIDLKFSNPFERPVALECVVVEGRLRTRVFGHPADDLNVEVTTSRLRRIGAGVRTVSDRRLSSGRRVTVKRARSGYGVTVNRIIRKEGEPARSEIVSRDYYPPQSGLVRIGAARRKMHRPRAAAEPPAESQPPVEPAGEPTDPL